MSGQIVATKGNLIHARKSLALAKNGYQLMDRKRNILIREMMQLVDKVHLLRDEITDAYKEGYYLLQQANLSYGMIRNVVDQIPVETHVSITYRSVMGVEVPTVLYEPDHEDRTMPYGLQGTSSRIDEAFLQFQKVKELTMILAEVDNSVYRLANAIHKTQKRANALKNIVIPGFEHEIRVISDSLEEKEREEFSRMKVIKQQKNARAKQLEQDKQA